MKQFIVAAILGAVAFVPGVADAQSYRDGSHGYYSNDQRHDRGREHVRHPHRGHRGYQRVQHRGIAHRAPPRYRTAPRHTTRVVYTPARPAHYYHGTRWQRGQYLPPHYRGGAYYVDHRHHRFAPPPPGHRYVRIDGDAVLIGVATGLITAVLAGAFH